VTEIEHAINAFPLFALCIFIFLYYSVNMFVSHTLLKVGAVLMVGVFLFVTGPAISTGMMISTDGVVSPCPLMDGQSGLCPVSITAHILSWQQLSTALPTIGMFVISLFTLIAFAAVFLALRKFLLPPYLRRLRKRQQEISIFSELFLALSRGRIHSRLFA